MQRAMMSIKPQFAKRCFSTASGSTKPAEFYHAPVPVRKNAAVAAVLALFVASVYGYTVFQVQNNMELGQEFDQVFESDKPKDAATSK